MKCQRCGLWEKKGKRKHCKGCDKLVCKHCWIEDQHLCIDCADLGEPEPDGVYHALLEEGIDVG